MKKSDKAKKSPTAPQPKTKKKQKKLTKSQLKNIVGGCDDRDGAGGGLRQF